MFNLDNVTSKNDNRNWPYRTLLIGPSGCGKTNTLLNFIQQQDNNIIDKIYLYAKDLAENAAIKNLNNKNAFIHYWNSIDDIYDNIDD